MGATGLADGGAPGSLNPRHHLLLAPAGGVFVGSTAPLPFRRVQVANVPLLESPCTAW